MERSRSTLEQKAGTKANKQVDLRPALTSELDDINDDFENL